MAYKYKTKNGEDFVIPGIGRTVKGEITTDQKIENANFQLVSDDSATAQGPVADSPAAPVQSIADTPAPTGQVQSVQSPTAPTQNQTPKESN
jgi:hypothetical protein